MNIPRDKFQQENHAQPAKGVDGRKVWEMEEEMELLREQVNSLKQLLSHENQLANYYFQELEETKRELDLMNEELNILAVANYKSVNEIQEFDKNSIKRNTCNSKPIDEISSGSAHCCPVAENEFKPIDDSTSRTTIDKIIVQSRESRIHLRKIRSNSSEIKTRSDTIKDRSEKLVHRAQEIRVPSRKAREELRYARGDDNNLQKPALHP